MGRDRDASRRRRQETPNKIEDQGSSPCREVPQRLSIIEGNEATVPKKRTYDSISPAGTTESQVPPSTGTAVKKHKKMKRKKNKAKRSNAILNNDCSNFDESVSSDNIPLEGSMVGSHMTLLDRSMGIVYSALERQDDSARKQIGTIDHNGSIKLASRESSGKILIVVRRDSMYRSRPGPSIVVFVRSNIMPENWYTGQTKMVSSHVPRERRV